MKKGTFCFAILFLIFSLILFQSCVKNNCPPQLVDPVNDLAGYLDGENRVLYTTSEMKEGVLEALEAKLVDGNIYDKEILTVNGEPVSLRFIVMEVENPAAFEGLDVLTIGYEPILAGLEANINEAIDNGDPNLLEDNVLLATGIALGQLALQVKEENNQRILDDQVRNKGTVVDSAATQGGKVLEALKQLVKDGRNKAKIAGKEIAKKVKQDDKEGAKKEGKKLGEDLESDWGIKLKLGYDFGGYGTDSSWTWWPKYPPWDSDPKPDLINEFVNNEIKFKVYSNAKCSEIANPTLSFTCAKTFNFGALPGKPSTWYSVEPVASFPCVRGDGFCVEQEVVIYIDKIYSDSLCQRLIDIKTTKGFSCK